MSHAFTRCTREKCIASSRAGLTNGDDACDGIESLVPNHGFAKCLLVGSDSRWRPCLPLGGTFESSSASDAAAVFRALRFAAQLVPDPCSDPLAMPSEAHTRVAYLGCCSVCGRSLARI